MIATRAPSDTRLPVVDGLRAFAVVAVVLFHGFPGLVPGGYIGVDVFFAISGFVIALRYLEPLIAREISIGTFFLRRVRRLVPAYFAVLVATTVAAAFIMAPKDLLRFAWSLLGQSFYAQNAVFWFQGEYFDAALRKPLLHTWSLAIEEQFYLCFPLLILAARWRPQLTFYAGLLLAVAMIAAATIVEPISPKTSFYWLPFRAWEFLAGIGAAILYMRGFARNLPPAVANAIGIAAILGLLASALLFDEESASILTQGLLAITATGAICLVQSRLSASLAALFTNGVSQHFGRISYSWYLWHWPPLSFVFLLQGQPAQGFAAIALTLLGYGLGLVSWHLLERRASRSSALAKPARTIGLLLAFLAFAAAAGTALIASNGFLQRYPLRERPLLTAQMDRPDGRCDFVTRLRNWRGQICPVNDVDGANGILFLGDSHVEMQKTALAELGSRYGVPIYITKQNCRIIDFGVDRNCRLPVWRQIERDIAREKIGTVVIVALWPEPFDAAPLTAALDRLAKTGVRVVLERPTPVSESLSPEYYMTRPDAWSDRSEYSRAAHAEQARSVATAMSAWAARHEDAIVLDPTPILCPGDACLYAKASEPLYSDTHHLTKVGARLLAQLYAPLMQTVARDKDAKPKAGDT
ncbi:acyltransferase family protein [Novosphingobium aquimarinum]|uniref:acyltransferase family protein n=1 Tax=Novosphingobium aquimarinum TaxID=2682494 RepID=UPI0018DC44FD|nr:acyltransferase family protein [Novosphingobium aquimarinum]